MAALVVAHDAVGVGQRPDEIVPDAQVHAERVDEDDRPRVDAPFVAIMRDRAVDFGEGHGEAPPRVARRCRPKAAHGPAFARAAALSRAGGARGGLQQRVKRARFAGGPRRQPSASTRAATQFAPSGKAITSPGLTCRLGLSTPAPSPPRVTRTPPLLDGARRQAAGLEEARAPQPDVGAAGFGRPRSPVRASCGGPAAGGLAPRARDAPPPAWRTARAPRTARRSSSRRLGVARSAASATDRLRPRRPSWRARSRGRAGSARPGRVSSRARRGVAASARIAPAASGSASRASASSRSSAAAGAAKPPTARKPRNAERLGRRQGMGQGGQRLGGGPPARPRQRGEHFADQPRLRVICAGR